MTIAVKFFASLREQTGINETSIPEAANLCVRDVWQLTTNIVMPPNTLMAVNHVYAQADTAVKAGDEVAFFPPVTGG